MNRIALVVICILSVGFNALAQSGALKKIENLINDDDVEKALVICNAEVDKKNGSAQLYYLRGVCLRKTGTYDKAMTDLNKARRMDTMNAKVYAEMGTVCALTNDTLNALINYGLSLKLNNKSSTTYNALGAFYYQIIDNDSMAIINFKKAIELDKKNYRALFNMGNLLVYERRYEEAIPFLEKTLNIHSKNSKAYLELGKAKYNLGLYKEAVECLKRAEKLNTNGDPNERAESSDIYEYLSKCYTRMGDPKKAEEYETKGEQVLEPD